MEYFDEEDTFSLEGHSEDVVLPYHEEDWELAAEPQQSLPYLEPDDNISQSEHLEPYTQQQLASFYHNPILERGDLYTKQFLETSADHHPEFKHLLLNFYQSLERVTQLQQDNEQWSENIQRLCQKIFDTATEQAKAEAYCQDQRKVAKVHYFTSCNFNQSVAHELKKVLSDTLRVGVDDTSLALYSMMVARLECEQFIYETAKLLKHHSENLINNTDSVKSSILVQLCDESVDCLRQCISTLFYYLRRQDSADNEFYGFSKRWMCQLVTLLYDVTQDGSCQNLLNEEMFVLNHIIRSPPGTQSWAERIIQISTPRAESDFWNSKVVLDHVIYMLFLVLRAPKGREDFLSNTKSSYSLSSSSRQDSLEINGNWTLLDEDGDELKGVGSKWHVLPHESDLVSLYRQIPFEAILSHVFSLKINKGLYSYTSERMTSDRFLQVLACCDIMCEVLGEGLATLGTPNEILKPKLILNRYKQLVRRIAQTLRNIVLLMSEHWNKFKENLENNPQRHSFERLQKEYDEFVKRCVERLLCVARLGVYQFLADLPFQSVSQRAAEVLYVLMNVPAGSRAEVDQLSRTSYTRQEWLDFVEDPDTKLAFEEQLSGMPENEVVYLLTTFCNLAFARPTTESHLVNIIAMDVYKVSFVYTSTRDICSKMGRELLCTVANVHPYIISTILQYLNKSSDEITSTALYAVSDLPFQQWIPTKQDIALFQEWILKYPVASIPVKLVQTAIKGMKWDFTENGCLFLPHSLHCEMAMLLVKVCCRYEREKQDSGLFVKSIDHVSRVASVMRSSLSFDESFLAWIWDVLLRLKLHRSQLITSDNPEARDKPNPFQDVNDGTVLPQANKAKVAQSCYVTIMMTNVGHSMNVFLQQGTFLLKTIVESGNKIPAIQCLSCILPMFMKAGVDLSINTSFTTILRDCLACTESGMLSGIASKLFEQRASVASPVILLCGAISDQISEDEAVLVIGYWIKLVLAIPGWWDNDNLKFLLDFLFKTAFNEQKRCFNECRAILYERYVEIMMQSSKKNTLSPQHQNRSVISSIIGLVSGSNSAGASSFLRDITSNNAYLTYFILDAETRYEDDTKLWPTLLSSMKTSSPEVALKKVCSLLKLHHSPIPNQLAIYRWAVFMIATPTDHPLLPVICQKFFLRYIFIMPDIGSSAGTRFFKPPQTHNLFKNLEEKFSNIGNDALLTSDDESRMKVIKLYQTFNVWISEDKLHDDNLYLPSLPFHYEPHLLAMVRTRNPNLWLDYVNFGKISEELHHVAVIWQNFHKHEVKPFPSHSSSMSMHATICQRITQLLRQFESPLTLDDIREDITSPIAVGHLSNLTDHRSVSEEIDQDLKSISKFAHVFADVKSKILVLNRNYMELLPDLYSMEEKTISLNIECQSSFSSTHRCSGPAQVQLKFLEKTLNEGVSHTLQTNRNTYRDMVCQLCNPSTSAELCYSALHLTNVIKALTKNTANPMHADESIKNIFEAGSKLFYTLADMNSDERWKCPTTQHLLTLCLDMLGQIFICGRPDQAVLLLEQMLRRPDIAALLSAHFSPAKACYNVKKDKTSFANFNTAVLVDMYERVVNAAINDKSQTSPDVLFVLITKFDLELWCRECTPPKADIMRLLQAIVYGLETHSANSSIEEESSIQMTKSFHLSNSAVQEIFTTHLCIVVKHSPNTVFFNAMNLLLNASAKKSLDWIVWEALISATFKNSEYSANQSPVEEALTGQSVDQCIKYLAVYFSEIRKEKRCGLYADWSLFVEPLSNLIHCLCVSKINYHIRSEHSGMSGQNNVRYHAILVDTILPLFSAWLVPYSSDETNGVLWPWEKAEQSSADHMLNTFSTVVNVMCNGADISPCVTTVWRYYIDNVIVSHNSFAPNYICSSYQTALSSVKWSKFIPTLIDLDTMIQLYDSKLSPSLHFLCFVIPEIDWNLIMNMCFQTKDDKENWSEHTPEVLGRLLNLLFKLASDESRVISYDKLKILLHSLDDFPWSLVDYSQLDYMANLVSERYNAFCLLKKFSMEPKGRIVEDQRYSALRLLQLVSCVPLVDENFRDCEIQNRKMALDDFNNDEMIWYKRQSYVRCVGRLIRTTKVTDKGDARMLEVMVCEQIKRMMKSLYFAVMSTDVKNLNEHCLSLIYSEIWRYLMNFPTNLVESTRRVIFTSLSEHINGVVCQDPSKSSLFGVVLISIASSAFSTLTDPTHIAMALEHCFEHCIHSFKSVVKTPKDDSTDLVVGNGNVDSAHLSTWKELSEIFSRSSKVSQQELLNECIKQGNMLTLNAFSQTMFTATNECDSNTKNNAYQCSLTIIQWFSTCVPTAAIEAKLLLLVGSFLKSCSYLMLVAEMNSDVDINMHSVNDVLASVVPILEQWCIDKVKTGILGSLGIGTASPLSLGFRAACRCLLLYINGNLPKARTENDSASDESNLEVETLRKLPVENRVYFPESKRINEVCDLLTNELFDNLCNYYDVMTAIISVFFPESNHYLCVL